MRNFLHSSIALRILFSYLHCYIPHTGGSDFTQILQEVVFSGNAGTSQQVSIPITDDNVVEMMESFRVELQFGPEEVETDNIFLTPNEATVTVTDNDSTLLACLHNGIMVVH